MGDVVIFPLVWREQSTRKRKRLKADFFVFPHHLRRNEIKRHAYAMRAMSAKGREDYLTEVLEVLCAELAQLGIDCRDCQNDAVYDLAEAVGRELHGPQFTLQRGAQ